MTPAREQTSAPLIDFAGLYAAYARDVRRFALFLAGDAALADDLVSEAFVRVWTARDRVELATVRSYLFAIVRNLFLHDLRAHYRRAPLDERMVDGRPDPEHRASDRSDLQVVIAALAHLPEVDRAALLMRADEGVSYEEIAAALGLTVAAARVKVHRARLKLAEARLGARSAIRTEEIRREPHS
jgi:RNA polymerase sigma-70 factor (ECF subfamily)